MPGVRPLNLLMVICFGRPLPTTRPHPSGCTQADEVPQAAAIDRPIFSGKSAVIGEIASLHCIPPVKASRGEQRVAQQWQGLFPGRPCLDGCQED